MLLLNILLKQYIYKLIYFLPLFFIPFFQICQANEIKSILNEFKETAFFNMKTLED